MQASLNNVVASRVSAIQRKVAPKPTSRSRAASAMPGRSYSFPDLSARVSRARDRVNRARRRP